MINKYNKLSSAIRGAILFGLATSTSQLAFAAEDVNTEEAIERIEITGSRLLREGAVAPSPVTAISGDELLKTGRVSLGDALNELPQLAPTNSLANSGGNAIGTAGLNLLDLRSMGSERTLVLVNGKRHVSTVAGSSSIDVNSIPTAWVERVEIITGGASAVYGADAVTGVVNFILKKNVEGFEAEATYGDADDSGFNTKSVLFSYGTNFDNGRGNIAVSAQYMEQDRLKVTDRDATNISYTSLKNLNRKFDNNDPAYPDKILTPNAGYWGINNKGVLWNPYTGEVYEKTFDDNGELIDINTGDNVDGLKCGGEDCDHFNLAQYDVLQPVFDSANVNVKVNYDLNDDWNAYFEGKYAESNAENMFQPSFLFYGSASLGLGAVHRDNAFVNDDLGEFMDNEGLDMVAVNRMNENIGLRMEDNKRETTRFVTGIEGVLFDEWDTELFLVWGKTDITRTNKNNIIIDRWNQSIDAIEDENGNIVCADEEARAAGCQPLSLFSNTDEYGAADWMMTRTVGDTEIEQLVVGGSMANPDLFEIPMGYVSGAFGFEYRDESSKSTETTLDVPEGTETYFNTLGEDDGDFDVYELFGELAVPLLSDMYLAEDVSLELAYRWADYSHMGSHDSWKAGLNWTVNDQVRFRGTVSDAYRAPNIGEAFGAASQTYASVDDPCKSSELDLLHNSDTRRKNCAALGIPTEFDSDYDSRSLEAKFEGNEDLNGEDSTSYTAGFVLTPDAIENFSVTVDWWRIELEGVISSVGYQDILDRCVDAEGGIENQYCNRITRDDKHEVVLIRNSLLNLSKQEAEGVDFEFAYDFNAIGGEFKTNLIGTYLVERKFYEDETNTKDYTDYAGTTGEAEWQGNLSISYLKDNWVAGLNTRYLDGVDLYTANELEDNANPSNIMSYGTYVISDLTFGYNFDNGVGLNLGVENVFDKSLPFGSYGTGAGSASYDNIGRFFWLRASFKM